MDLNVIISIERYQQLPWGLRRSVHRGPNEADIFDICCYFIADDKDEYLPFEDAVQKLWNATDDDIEAIITTLKTQLGELANTALPLASKTKS